MTPHVLARLLWQPRRRERGKRKERGKRERENNRERERKRERENKRERERENKREREREREKERGKKKCKNENVRGPKQSKVRTTKYLLCQTRGLFIADELKFEIEKTRESRHGHKL